MKHKTTFRSEVEKWFNFIFFPYRAFILNPNQSSDSLMCLRDERMWYVSQHLSGKVLDLGCGPDNVFIKNYTDDGTGLGMDIYPYPGLSKEQVLKDPTALPFKNGIFDTVTLIANINHIPQSIVQQELAEIARVLKPGGKVIITRIGLITSLLTHTVVKVQSWFSDKYYDMDSERGVEEDERYTVSKSEIKERLEKVGLFLQTKQSFWTQWWLNELLIYKKEAA